MGEYDQAMRLLVDADPLALARFLLRQNPLTRYLTEPGQGLRLVSQLNTEFQGTEARADGLFMLEHGKGQTFILHPEVQTRHDSNMGERMIDYGHRIRQKHGSLPIAAFVIYLLEDAGIQEPPYCWPFFDGPPTLTFHYTCVKLWEVERAEVVDLKRPALLPLALLTKGGANRIIVKDMFQELLSNQLHDLLPIGQTIAGWLLKGMDLEWLRKEYRDMLELFKDSPAYQWMVEDAHAEGFERGIEQGLERGRGEVRKAQEQAQQAQKQAQQAREAFRQTIVALVEERYPEWTDLARRQVQAMTDLECLQQAILRVSLSKDSVEAASALLERAKE